MMPAVMIRRTTLVLAVGLLVGRGNAALAGSEPFSAHTQPQGSLTHQPSLRVQILAGGGLGQFTGSDARKMADTAATWQLRSVFATRTPVGAELAYVGNFQELRAAGHRETADLYGHGAEFALRAQAPLARGQLRLAPFAFAGVGWTRYHLSASPSPLRPVVEPLQPPDASLRSGRRLAAADWTWPGPATTDDDVVTLPVGAGLSLGLRRLVLDARLTFRPTFAEDRLLGAFERTSDLASWSATVALGYQL